MHVEFFSADIQLVPALHETNPVSYPFCAQVFTQIDAAPYGPDLVDVLWMLGNVLVVFYATRFAFV